MEGAWFEPLTLTFYGATIFAFFGKSGNFEIDLWVKSKVKDEKLSGSEGIWTPIYGMRVSITNFEVKKISNGGSGINLHYSGSHWASVFGRFAKTFGQARSLLYVNS